MTKGDTVQICIPAIGRDDMNRSVQVSQTGTISVNVSETPVFVMPTRAANPDAKNSLSSLQVYPNPATDYIKLTLENGDIRPVDVTIFDNSGRKCKQISLPKLGRVLNEQLDLSALAHGLYLLEVRQGPAKLIKKIILNQ